MVKKILRKSDISKLIKGKKKHVWLSGRLHIEGRLNEGPRLQRKHKYENEAKRHLCDLPLLFVYFQVNNGVLYFMYYVEDIYIMVLSVLVSM